MNFAMQAIVLAMPIFGDWRVHKSMDYSWLLISHIASIVSWYFLKIIKYNVDIAVPYQCDSRDRHPNSADLFINASVSSINSISSVHFLVVLVFYLEIVLWK